MKNLVQFLKDLYQTIFSVLKSNHVICVGWLHKREFSPNRSYLTLKLHPWITSSLITLSWFKSFRLSPHQEPSRTFRRRWDSFVDWWDLGHSAQLAAARHVATLRKTLPQLSTAPESSVRLGSWCGLSLSLVSFVVNNVEGYSCGETLVAVRMEFRQNQLHCYQELQEIDTNM